MPSAPTPAFGMTKPRSQASGHRSKASCHPDGRSRTLRHRSKVGGISSGRKRAHCTGGDDLHGTVGASLCRPVIPTAGVGLYGTGQRLEGSLVEGSVRIARVETTYMAQWRTALQNSCAMHVISYRWQAGAPFRFEIPLAVGLCLRHRRLLSE